jgi:serine/threonine-protein kinase
VAVKVLRRDGPWNEREREERLARFLREQEILRRVSHPNIVRVLGMGTDPSPFLVEEFVPGGDLKTLLRDGGEIPLPRAIDLLWGILRGLAELHDLGIVHRDLKPGNILLRKDGEPVIADFGLATMKDLAALTLEPAILGTLHYMAPEQLRGAPADCRSDVFSFGVLAFQVLSSSLPFAGDGPREILRNMEQQEPARLEEFRPAAPRPLADLIHKALAREAASRFASAAEALAALEAIAARTSSPSILGPRLIGKPCGKRGRAEPRS